MNWVVKILAASVMVILLSIANVSVAYLLPYPWDKLNVIFAVLILLIVFRGTGLSVWLVFFSYFIIELYTITPFGVTLISATWGALFCFWLYQHVFTNRSWYAALGLSILTLLSYRLLYVGLLSLTGLFHPGNAISLSLLLPLYGWEILFTTGIVGVLYGILSPFARKLDTATLRW